MLYILEKDFHGFVFPLEKKTEHLIPSPQNQTLLLPVFITTVLNSIGSSKDNIGIKTAEKPNSSDNIHSVPQSTLRPSETIVGLLKSKGLLAWPSAEKHSYSECNVSSHSALLKIKTSDIFKGNCTFPVFFVWQSRLSFYFNGIWCRDETDLQDFPP